MTRTFENFEPLLSKCPLFRASQVYYYKLARMISTYKLYSVPLSNIAQQRTLRITKRHTPKVRTNSGKQEPAYQSIDLLNKTETLLDFTLPFPQFKSKLRQILIDNNIFVGQRLDETYRYILFIKYLQLCNRCAYQLEIL